MPAAGGLAWALGVGAPPSPEIHAYLCSAAAFALLRALPSLVCWSPRFPSLLVALSPSVRPPPTAHTSYTSVVAPGAALSTANLQCPHSPPLSTATLCSPTPSPPPPPPRPLQPQPPLPLSSFACFLKMQVRQGRSWLPFHACTSATTGEPDASTASQTAFARGRSARARREPLCSPRRAAAPLWSPLRRSRLRRSTSAAVRIRSN